MTGTLVFNAIQFYGFHGMHKGEDLIGTYFTVQIEAQLKADFLSEAPNLQNSVNYEDLFKVLKTTFDMREDFIETVALNIHKALKKEFLQVAKWKVSVEKQNPLGKGHFNAQILIED